MQSLTIVAAVLALLVPHHHHHHHGRRGLDCRNVQTMTTQWLCQRSAR